MAPQLSIRPSLFSKVILFSIAFVRPNVILAQQPTDNPGRLVGGAHPQLDAAIELMLKEIRGAQDVPRVPQSLLPEPQLEVWHGRPAREITRKIRVPPQTDHYLRLVVTYRRNRTGLQWRLARADNPAF